MELNRCSVWNGFVSFPQTPEQPIFWFKHGLGTGAPTNECPLLTTVPLTDSKTLRSTCLYRGTGLRPRIKYKLIHTWNTWAVREWSFASHTSVVCSPYNQQLRWWDFRFSPRRIWIWQSSGMFSRVLLKKLAGVSKVLAPIFRATPWL
jgi:hypothetical protein